MQRCQKYVDNITTEAEPNVHHPYSQANLDSLNQGMLDTNGNRNPPTYVGHVDDHLYADIAAYFPRTVACSIQALEDTLGGSHEFQEDVLSDEKLNMTYREYQTVLGFQPNTRTMMVKISPRQKDKIIHFIEFEGWHNTKKQATIKEVA